MKDLQVFNYKNKEVRTLILEEENWWVAKDVCDCLEIKNVSHALKKLTTDEKKTVHNLDFVHSLKLGSKVRSISLVNESGLYSLILFSRKKEAIQFKRWITHEILPSIRKTGMYSISQKDLQPRSQAEVLHEITGVLVDHEVRLKSIEKQMLNKEPTQTLLPEPEINSKSDKVKRKSFVKMVRQHAYDYNKPENEVYNFIYTSFFEETGIDLYYGFNTEGISVIEYAESNGFMSQLHMFAHKLLKNGGME